MRGHKMHTKRKNGTSLSPQRKETWIPHEKQPEIQNTVCKYWEIAKVTNTIHAKTIEWGRQPEACVPPQLEPVVATFRLDSLEDTCLWPYTYHVLIAALINLCCCCSHTKKSLNVLFCTYLWTWQQYNTVRLWMWNPHWYLLCQENGIEPYLL